MNTSTLNQEDPTILAQSAPTLGAALPLVFGDDPFALSDELDRLAAGGDETAVPALMRIGLLQPGRTTRWHQSLLNRWNDLGRPAMKPNAIEKTAAVLSDHTVDNITPLVTAFAAARGVHLEIEVKDYDSVELEALNPRSSVYSHAPDYALVILSDRWLNRHLGGSGLVRQTDLETCVDALRKIAGALLEHGSSQVLITAFPPGSNARPGGQVLHSEMIGRSAALARLNLELHQLQNDRLFLVDLPSAVHAAGGAGAYSPTNYLRAKMPYAQACTIAIATEIAAGIASLCGKTHRALITDLDNTLWGGVIGDLGVHAIITGQDSPDGLGYFLLQSYMKDLRTLGVPLAISSKNSPDVFSAFDDNPNIALDRSDFSSAQINWDPKSRSIATISSELGFGPEYMLFVDDNMFELAEALGQHPYLDIVHAAEDPCITLARLATGRYFHTLHLTDNDLSRQRQIAAKRAAEQAQQQFDNYDDYLRSLDIRVTVTDLNEANRSRVLQLLQKTNQFNLTTRRHTDADLDALEDAGASFGVFSYEDAFGPQGIISAVILVPEGDLLRIDSWVMSCRVLNRTVENAIHAWIVARAEHRPVVGEFIGTEKNGPVRDLYKSLGFELSHRDAAADRELWTLHPTPADARTEPIAHLIES